MAYHNPQNQTYYPEQQSSYPQYPNEGYDTSMAHQNVYNTGYSSHEAPKSAYTPNEPTPYDTSYDDYRPQTNYPPAYPTDYDYSQEDYASTVQLNNGPENNRDAPVPFNPDDYAKKEEYSSTPLDRGKKKKYGFLNGIFCCKGCAKWCAIICCLIVLIIIGLVIAVLVLGKKPTVDFIGTAPPPDGKQPYVNRGTALDFNFGLRFNVMNPNPIGATFTKIQATAFYPGHPSKIGGGSLSNVRINAKSNNTIIFPFSINYNSTEDPQLKIISDIVKKCGFANNGKEQPITINYTLKLTFRVIIPISVSSDRSTNITCPIKDGNVPAIPGLDISSLTDSFTKL